ncbi:hypothetical protein SKAU_G00400260 [Synaphobranchus kaupii]|uniref:Ig-like domain-containing protein n=1 Tax=Synaphobranchus kaupii TaxID=118154 RepID=A0A9Q1E8Z9_SYNKA|nr:hypothetical protein SKAU_G00400260 [Synaphobranchus kaupii]
MDFHNLFLSVLLLSALGCCAGQEQALKPGVMKALVGANVSFVTTIDPLTQIFVVKSWTFNSGPGPVPIVSAATGINVDPEYKDRIIFNITSGNLVLKEVTTSDTGDYSVIMVKEDGKQIPGEVKLIVYEPVSDVAVKANATELVEFNDTVSLTCTAAGTEPTYKWLSGATAVESSDRMQLSEDQTVLTISGILRSDEGPFICSVSNPLSDDASAPLTLNISYGPENTAMTASLQKSVYRSGSNITLSCSAESSPPAEFEWTFNDETLKETGAELQLENIQQSQSGNYSCLASNTKTMRYTASAVAPIIVLEAISGAQITGPTTPLIAGNSSANISCQAASGTVTTTEWLKNGKSLSASETVTFSGDRSSVAISPVEKTDSGEYKCELTNEVNIDSASYQMTVNFGPEDVAISGADEVKVKTEVKLMCSAVSVPPATYTWTFNGTIQAETTAEYTVKEAAYRNSGKYECVANNAVTGKNASVVYTLAVKEEIYDGLSGGAIAGIVIGVLAGLAILAGVAHCLTKKQKVTESPY